MSKEEFIGKLELCYFGDRNAFDEIVSVYDELNERIDKAIEYSHGRLAFLENCFGGNDIEIRACISIHNEYLKILKDSYNKN